jgi:hypothetical protein
MNMQQGTVLIVPGSFGSALAVNGKSVWWNPIALLEGAFEQLTLPPPPGVQVVAQGMLDGYFTLMESALKSEGYNVITFPYDFRINIDAIAPLFQSLIFSSAPPVYILTHSLGATVARRALQFLATQMGPDEVLARVKSLAMLGPANAGTLAAALAIGGAVNELPHLKLLPMVPAYVQTVLSSWPALYQTLPYDPNIIPSLNNADCNIRNAGFWAAPIDANLLYKFIPPDMPSWLAKIDTDFLTPKITIILGDAPETAGGVYYQHGRMLVDPQYNLPGDGYVPRASSLLRSRPATYLASGVDHLKLPIAAGVIQAVVNIFNGRTPTSLTLYRQ